jgi:hypothetical protein
MDPQDWESLGDQVLGKDESAWDAAKVAASGLTHSSAGTWYLFLLIATKEVLDEKLNVKDGCWTTPRGHPKLLAVSATWFGTTSQKVMVKHLWSRPY